MQWTASRIRFCKLHDSLCLSGAGFLGLLGQQLSGAASGSGYTGKHFFPGSGTVQLIQLSLYSVTLFGLGFQVVVIGVFCTLTVQAFGDDCVHFILCESAPGLLLHGSSGGGRSLQSGRGACGRACTSLHPLTVANGCKDLVLDSAQLFHGIM